MFSRSIVRRQFQATRTAAPALRPFSQASRNLARKDAQGKDDMVVEPNEYSKSGSDDAAAESDAAFSRDKTTPESQHASAEGESGGNPLDASPANPEISKPRPQQEGGSEGSSSQSGQGPSDRERSSGKGESKKGGQGGKKYDS